MSEQFPFHSVNPAEQRRQVEDAIGPALDEAFDRNASFVVRDAAGTDTLTLYFPSERGMAVSEVSQTVDANGNRIAHMSYGWEGDKNAAWDNHWEFTDGPRRSPRVEPRRRDSQTGQFTPIPGSRRGYNPNTDEEVAYWAKVWPENLRNGLPERPVEPNAFKRFLGRVGFRSQ